MLTEQLYVPNPHLPLKEKLCEYACLSTGCCLLRRQQLAAEAARADAAVTAASEAEAVWQEVLMQTEEDLDKRAEYDGNRLAAAQRTAEEVSCSPE